MSRASGSLGSRVRWLGGRRATVPSSCTGVATTGWAGRTSRSPRRSPAFLRLVPGAIEQLGPGASDLRLVLPELVEAVPGLPEPLAADSDTLRHRLAEAVAGWLREASSRRPVLLVIDDLHWADRGTGQLVQHVLASIDHRAVAVAITYRTTEGEGDVDLAQLISQLRRLGNVERVSLDGLDVDDILVDGRRVRARLRRATSPVSSTSGPEAMPSSPPRCCSTSTPTTTRRSASRPFPRRSTTSSSPESPG